MFQNKNINAIKENETTIEMKSDAVDLKHTAHVYSGLYRTVYLTLHSPHYKNLVKKIWAASHQ